MTGRSCDGRTGEVYSSWEEESALSPADGGAGSGGSTGTDTGNISREVTYDGPATLQPSGVSPEIFWQNHSDHYSYLLTTFLTETF